MMHKRNAVHFVSVCPDDPAALIVTTKTIDLSRTVVSITTQLAIRQLATDQTDNQGFCFPIILSHISCEIELKAK